MEAWGNLVAWGMLDIDEPILNYRKIQVRGVF